jgi:hypothetical protein
VLIHGQAVDGDGDRQFVFLVLPLWAVLGFGDDSEVLGEGGPRISQDRDRRKTEVGNRRLAKNRRER